MRSGPPPRAPRPRRPTRPDAGRRLPPDARRTEIIDAAVRLFRTRPYAELGVADVARAAGITQGLVYHYFESKEAVFAAACELQARELLRYCLPDEPALPYAAQVERGVRGYLDFVEEHGVEYRNLFTGPTAGEPQIQAICETTRQAIIDRFVAALGLAAGACPATHLSLRGYIGYAEGAIVTWLAGRTLPRATLERLLLAALTSALTTGLASERRPPLGPEALSALESAFRLQFGL